MGVPRSKHTKSRRNKRRLHQFLEAPGLVSCQKCGNFILPHTLCPYCGYYKGREVIDVLAKLDKKERKKREREMKMVEETKKEKPLSWEELSKK
jgi:large subunit ribosomal protein L32